MKAEIKWHSIEDRLPEDDWKEEFGEDKVGCLCDDFLVVIKSSEPLDELEVAMCNYTLPYGFLKYSEESYDWSVTHWAQIPDYPGAKAYYGRNKKDYNKN